MGIAYAFPFLFSNKTLFSSYRSMKIITPEIGQKEITLIPRNSDIGTSVTIHSESENKDFEFDIIDIIETSYYYTLVIDFTEELLENSYYMLLLKNNNIVTFGEKLFVTSQQVDEFSVNNNPNGTPIYKSNITTNEYIVYGE